MIGIRKRINDTCFQTTPTVIRDNRGAKVKREDIDMERQVPARRYSSNASMTTQSTNLWVRKFWL